MQNFFLFLVSSLAAFSANANRICADSLGRHLSLGERAIVALARHSAADEKLRQFKEQHPDVVESAEANRHDETIRSYRLTLLQVEVQNQLMELSREMAQSFSRGTEQNSQKSALLKWLHHRIILRLSTLNDEEIDYPTVAANVDLLEQFTTDLGLIYSADQDSEMFQNLMKRFKEERHL